MQQAVTDRPRPQPPSIAGFAAEFLPAEKIRRAEISAKFSQPKIRFKTKLRRAEIHSSLK
jgi:hypothetical protein